MTTQALAHYAADFDLDCADALDHAEEAGWTLNTHADPTADARQDCTLASSKSLQVV